MKPITVRFTPTVGDIVRMTFWVYRRWLFILIGTVLVPLICQIACQGLLSLRSGSATSEQLEQQRMMANLLLFLIPLAFAAIAFMSLFVIVPTLIAARNERIRIETTYTFDQNSVNIKDAHNELKQDWSNYSEARMTKWDVILVTAASKNLVRFIPRPAFESPEQEAALIELLKSKLKFKG